MSQLCVFCFFSFASSKFMTTFSSFWIPAACISPTVVCSLNFKTRRWRCWLHGALSSFSQQADNLWGRRPVLNINGAGLHKRRNLFWVFHIKTACNRPVFILRPSRLKDARIYDWRTTGKLNYLTVFIFTRPPAPWATRFDRINNSPKVLSHFVISACSCVWRDGGMPTVVGAEGFKPLWSSINFHNLDPILELIA